MMVNQIKNIHVNPDYSHLTDFLYSIPENFDSWGSVVHSDRNEIREGYVNGIHLAIKSFKRITWVNRVIFATIRKTKARRSYEYSMSILQKGISTPCPVAYIDCYKNFHLDKSYYVSLFTDWKPVNELFSDPLPESMENLQQFAYFSYKLHKAGIYHNDFNLENILFMKSEDNLDFALIDNNRIRFGKYSGRKGLKNFNRFDLSVEKLAVIISTYSKAARINDLKAIGIMIISRARFIWEVSIKKYIKKIFKPALMLNIGKMNENKPLA